MYLKTIVKNNVWGKVDYTLTCDMSDYISNKIEPNVWTNVWTNVSNIVWDKSIYFKVKHSVLNSLTSL